MLAKTPASSDSYWGKASRLLYKANTKQFVTNVVSKHLDI